VVVVLVLAGLAVLGAVVALAMGRGGGLAETHPDYPPLPIGADGRPITADEAARLRLPRTLWGYQPQVTDEALYRLADALSERDARVAMLERQLRDLRGAGREPAAGSVGALHGLEETGVNGSASRPHEEPAEDRLATDDRPDDRAGDGAGGRAGDEPAGRAREDRG